jgi:hypothetical protein
LGWIIISVWYLFTKVIKRIGLFRRNPWDIVFLPVSIFFGFAHGIIKVIALFTWNVVSCISSNSTSDSSNQAIFQTSWGSRPDGDINDSERMTPIVVPAEVMINPAAHAESLVRYRDEKRMVKREEMEWEIIDSGSEKVI